MKPKLLVLAMLVCALAGVSACGDDDEKSSSGSASKGAFTTNPDIKKIVRASANAQGLKGSADAKPRAGTRGVQQGEQVETSGLENDIVRVVKEKTGIDVRVECPPTVTYAPGATFMCKLYAPDGSSLDVKCTMLDSSQDDAVRVNWELVATQPTPPPAPNPQLEGAKAKANVVRGAAARGLEPGDTLDISGLGELIEQEIERQINENVAVECPPTVEFLPGSRFYCKLYTNNNTIYDVECTQGNNGEITWRVLA